MRVVDYSLIKKLGLIVKLLLITPTLIECLDMKQTRNVIGKKYFQRLGRKGIETNVIYWKHTGNLKFLRTLAYTPHLFSSSCSHNSAKIFSSL